MPDKYELIHAKMLDALEHAQKADRYTWLRETSFTGTVLDLRISFDRSPVDGTP